jgi:hypothetical protein
LYLGKYGICLTAFTHKPYTLFPVLEIRFTAFMLHTLFAPITILNHLYMLSLSSQEHILRFGNTEVHLTSFVSLTTARCLNPRPLNRRNTRGKEADCNIQRNAYNISSLQFQQFGNNACFKDNELRRIMNPTGTMGGNYTVNRVIICAC